MNDRKRPLEAWSDEGTRSDVRELRRTSREDDTARIIRTRDPEAAEHLITANALPAPKGIASTRQEPVNELPDLPDIPFARPIAPPAPLPVVRTVPREESGPPSATQHAISTAFLLVLVVGMVAVLWSTMVTH